MSEKLLNCPFCGSEAKIKRIGNELSRKREIEIKCTSIKCRTTQRGGVIRFGFDWLEPRMIANWNRRFVCLDKNGDKVFAGAMAKDVDSGFIGSVEYAPHRMRYGLRGKEGMYYDWLIENIELINEIKNPHETTAKADDSECRYKVQGVETEKA